MASSSELRRRFARQISLDEIGETGQARLMAVRAALPEDADAGASAIAEAYLRRAGVNISSPAQAEVIAPVPSTARIARIAGDPSLIEAARSIVGALAATETLKRVLGLGPSVAPAEAPALKLTSTTRGEA